MRPQVLKIDPQHIDHELIKQAAECIRNRGLVAFPTETVYGLGANALDGKAVAKIFEAKNRPLDDPLIVHIAEKKDIYTLAQDVPREIEKLIDCFWPGPLTVVLKKRELIPDIVTTGLDTVALRMPSNTIARSLILVSGLPIAAPSANLFGRPSPTLAEHVISDLEGRIDMILDGGATEIGIESTVVEFVDGKIIVLRPGGIDIDSIKHLTGDVIVADQAQDSHKSPGEYPRHYSPHARVILVEEGPRQIEEVLQILGEEKAKGHNVGVMAKEEHEKRYKAFNIKVLGPEKDARVSASRLFHLLREFDSEKTDVIVVEGVSEQGLGLAIMNRLRKAAGVEN